MLNKEWKGLVCGPQDKCPDGQACICSAYAHPALHPSYMDATELWALVFLQVSEGAVVALTLDHYVVVFFSDQTVSMGIKDCGEVLRDSVCELHDLGSSTGSWRCWREILLQ